MKTLLLVLMLGVMPLGLSTAAFADGATSGMNDFGSHATKARQMLQSRGYQVLDIKPDNANHPRVLHIKAKKNGKAYQIRLAYPSLKILSETRKD